MKEVTYQWGNVTVKLIDKSSHEKRKQDLKRPLADFFRKTERERYEKSVATQS